MAEKKEPQDVKASPIQKRERSDVERTRGETYVTPDVDIYEREDGLVLTADVPGVPKDGIELRLEDNTLQITAHRRALDGERDPDYAEYRPSSYYRAFSLSNDIDREKIEAKVADGVLTVTLPKSERAKPRKIEVAAG